jgi:hypothetical protein
MSQSGIINIQTSDLPPYVATSYVENSGTAIPVANVLNILGGAGITTSGTGNTVTVSLTGGLSAIETINGDSGSITGNTVTIFAGLSTLNSGSSVSFVNSGTTSTFNVTDASSNTIIGNLAGNASLTASFSVGLGYNALSTLTSGIGNVGIGPFALSGITSGSSNTGVGNSVLTYSSTASNNSAFGTDALTICTGGGNTAIGSSNLSGITSGSNNTALGYKAGNNYTGTESGNICLGYNVEGTIGESNITRIGLGGMQTACYIAGIDGVNVGSVAKVVTEASNQLGTATLTAGSGISITPTANTITIAVSGGGETWSDISGVVIASVGNGYFITATCTSTLPASPSEGDTVKYIVDSTQFLTITGNTGQKIRFNSQLSASAGTAVNTSRGDSVELVYRSTGTTWFALAFTGNWNIT